MRKTVRSYLGGQELFAAKLAKGAKMERCPGSRKLKVKAFFEDNTVMKPSNSARARRGFTLIELIVATAILVILTGLALPMARVAIKRERERELRHDLWELRDSIDRYKDAADRGAFQIKVGTEGYPPDLETLVNGVDVGGKKVRFLRRIPKDPMTGEDWGLRSMQDDPSSDSWGGQNVFDVFTKSRGTGLDGTEYKDW
jgi:general secretion pathway protein G